MCTVCNVNKFADCVTIQKVQRTVWNLTELMNNVFIVWDICMDSALKSEKVQFEEVAMFASILAVVF